MREVVAERCSSVMCLSSHQLSKIFSDKNQESKISSPVDGEEYSLLAIPAQCNFSGTKIPLSWVEKCQSGILGSSMYSTLISSPTVFL